MSPRYFPDRLAYWYAFLPERQYVTDDFGNSRYVNEYIPEFYWQDSE